MLARKRKKRKRDRYTDITSCMLIDGFTIPAVVFLSVVALGARSAAVNSRSSTGRSETASTIKYVGTFSNNARTGKMISSDVLARKVNEF